jgi:hypothetical protein
MYTYIPKMHIYKPSYTCIYMLYVYINLHTYIHTYIQGKHYAMKIQTKRGLLDSFADDPWRVDGIYVYIYKYVCV